MFSRLYFRLALLRSLRCSELEPIIFITFLIFLFSFFAIYYFYFLSHPLPTRYSHLHYFSFTHNNIIKSVHTDYFIYSLLVSLPLDSHPISSLTHLFFTLFFTSATPHVFISAVPLLLFVFLSIDRPFEPSYAIGLYFQTFYVDIFLLLYPINDYYQCRSTRNRLSFITLYLCK